MTLYVLNSSKFEALFGTRESPTPRVDIDIIAQTGDCSSFLVLSNTAYPQLDAFVSFAGYAFTYCQQWGLTINADVVARTIQDLRKNAYPPMADYLDAKVKANASDEKSYIDKCIAVKLRYPKL